MTVWLDPGGWSFGPLVTTAVIMMAIGALWALTSILRMILLASFGAVLLSLALFAWRREQRTRRLLGCVVQGTCPYCRYYLGGFTPEKLAVCPECGEPWPLVPSPAELAR